MWLIKPESGGPEEGKGQNERAALTTQVRWSIRPVCSLCVLRMVLQSVTLEDFVVDIFVLNYCVCVCGLNVWARGWSCGQV